MKLIKTMMMALGLLLGMHTAFATPVSDHGQLSVVDGRLVDKNGVEPQLRGMSFFWNIYNQEGGRFYTQGAVKTLANDWKVSVIRAAVADYNMTTTKNMIDWAIAAGIYIIVDNHQHSVQTQQAKNYFSQVSQYVKSLGNPVNVIYELYNEPQKGVTWSQVKAFALDVIPAIRANDANNIIVVGTPNYSADLPAAFNNPITGHNHIVYAFHFYSSASSHRSMLPYVKRAYCLKVPVMVTEWGTPNSDGGEHDGCSGSSINWEWNYEWLSWVETLKLSWASWSVSDKCEEASALRAPASSDGGWNSFSPSGTWVRSLIQKLNQGQTHPDISFKTIDCAVILDSNNTPEKTGGGNISSGAIQAENYTEVNGVEEIAYDKAQGDAYMGNFTDGSSITYWLQVDTAGTYVFWGNLASTVSGNLILGVGGGNGPINASFESTGSMTTFKDAIKVPVTLNAGINSLVIAYTETEGANIAFDAFIFDKPDSLDSINYCLVPNAACASSSSSSTLLTSNRIPAQWLVQQQNGQWLVPAAAGISMVRVYDLMGHQEAVFHVEQDADFSFNLDHLKSGVKIISLESQLGSWVRQIHLTR